MPRQSLAKPRRFAELVFETGSAPSDRTVRRWHANGDVAGCVIGSRRYIDLEAFEKSCETLFDKIVRDVSRRS